MNILKVSFTRSLCILLYVTLGTVALVSKSLASEVDEVTYVIEWPEHKYTGAKPIRFSVPREYLHEGTTFLNEDGSVKSFAVIFELPGPAPIKERQWLKGKKGTPEYEQFMKRWQGRFSMEIRQTGYGGSAARESMRREMSNPAAGYSRDGSIAGLERYSSLACLDKRFKNDALDKAIANKPTDDNAPPGCMMDRRFIVLISPENIGPEDAIAMRCMSTGCKLSFDVLGRTGYIRLAHKDIESWPKIVSAGKGLARRFATSY